jgi:hemoglobin
MRDIENRADIKILIDDFYKKIMVDRQIGHFFTEVVQLDMKQHMPKLYDFWETTLFQKATYKDNPILPHLAMHRKSPMTKTHFDRWMSLFLETVDELFEGEKATLTKQRAQSIATVMQIKIYELNRD